MPAVFFVIINIALIVYLISLAARLVRAVERIADNLEEPGPPRVSARIVDAE